MKCVVTGGAGFIGSNLTDRLLELGHEVLVVDNLSSGKKKNINKKAIFHNIDVVLNLNGFKQFADVETIFHLAAQSRVQPSFDSPVETSIANIFGTIRVLELARKIKAKVIYAGSSAFYGDPHLNPYALTKWLGEEQCILYNKVYNVPVSIARFFNVYGNRHVAEGKNAAVLGIFERQKKNNEPLTVTGCGNQRRDFTHVSDIVNGLISMSQGPMDAEIFNLGSGVNYSILEVANMFEPKEIVHLPTKPGEAWETLADISLAKKKLNWEPQQKLEIYVADFLKKLI